MRGRAKMKMRKRWAPIAALLLAAVLQAQTAAWQIGPFTRPAAGNPVLSGTYRSINARVQSLRFRTNQNETKWKRAIQDHEDMVEAMSARDADAMRAILVRHIRNKSDTVLDLMRAGALAPIAQHGT